MKTKYNIKYVTVVVMYSNSVQLKNPNTLTTLAASLSTVQLYAADPLISMMKMSSCL